MAGKIASMLIAIAFTGCVCHGRISFDPIGPCSPFDEHIGENSIEEPYTRKNAELLGVPYKNHE